MYHHFQSLQSSGRGWISQTIASPDCWSRTSEVYQKPSVALVSPLKLSSEQLAVMYSSKDGGHQLAAVVFKRDI